MSDNAIVLATAAWTNATAVDTNIFVDIDSFDAVTFSFIPTGSLTGGTLNFEGSDDNGTNWFLVFATRFGTNTTESTFALSGAAQQLWQAGCTGLTQFRIRLNPAITGAGTANLRLQSARTSLQPSSSINNATTIGAVTQAGTWTVQPGNTANTTAWKVDGSAVTQPVSGTFFQATQPVSGTFFQATQPVSIAATVTVAGAKTNDNAAPGATNIGALTAIANAAAPTWTEANLVGLSVDLAGNLRTSATIAANSSVNVAQIAGTATAVNNGAASAGTQRVTIANDSTGILASVTTVGTVTTVTAVTAITNALPTGANTIGKVDQGTGGASAWKVDGSAVTQPVSAASLPLPTGASTSAKQPALGTAGTASADVITVQGIAAMTALKVDGSAVTQPVSGTVTANQGGTWTVQPGNTANTTAWKVDGSAVTQPVSGTFFQATQPVSIAATVTVAGAKTNNAAVPGATNVGALTAVANAAAPTWTETNLVALSVDLAGNLRTSTSIAANSSVNVNQIAGTTTAVNNGVVSAGVQRVTIASDSTGQVTLATGANTIGALTANQSVNQTQVNGIAVSTGNGVSGTGVQRFTLASDSTGQVTLAAGANTIGALTANQSVNCAQMNGVAVTMGNGVSGTGVQRVTLASDSTGVVAITGTATVAGAKTNNNAVPGATNVGALTAVANAAAPTWTETNLVALSVDLAGNLRTTTAIAANSSVNVNQIAGTTTAVNNGVVSAGVQRVTIASDSTGQVALAAGTADVGKIRFSLPTTDAMTEAVINFTATGDNTVVAGTASQTIRVHRMFLVANSPTDIIFKDATGGTSLTGAMTMTKGGGMTFDIGGDPWFTTASSGAFVINQSGTAQISGRCYYTKS